jgi:hypothetical protein
MTQYSMTPINNGTRMRSDHNVLSTVIASYNRGQLVVGDELWTAPADGPDVKKGDKWVKVKSVDGVIVAERGWMALIHKGVAVCNNFQEIEDPDPPPTPVFPESFVLTDPNGAKAEYVFVRIIE